MRIIYFRDVFSKREIDIIIIQINIKSIGPHLALTVVTITTTDTHPSPTAA